jgi:hypothetical protein
MTFATTTAPPTPAPGSSVTDRHPDHLEHSAAWRRIRHMLAGADGVRANADEFLPATEEQRRRPALRRAYVQGASVYPASGRTVDALSGAIFRRDPTVRVPAQYDARLDNVDVRGNTVHGFAQTVVRETLALGRYGVLVDVPAGDAPTSVAASRPYLSGYTAETITNWRERMVNGALAVDQVVLRERAIRPAAFGSTDLVQYRLLELDEMDLYRVRIFQQVSSGQTVEVDRIEPKTFDGKRLQRIPFTFFSALDTRAEVRRSPLLDLVDCNVTHVKVAADLSAAISKVAAPTLVVIGAEMDADVQLGGVIYLPPETSCSLLEFKGDGLGLLERTLDRYERQMAVLGARLLEQPKRAAETAETTRLRQTSETSVLASVAKTVSDGIKSSLQIACDWDGISGEVSFELNSDFFDSVMDPGMLEALIRSVQSGHMPVDDLYYNLRRGELLRPDLTIERYREDLENNPLLLGRPSPLSLNSAPVDPAAEDGP